MSRKIDNKSATPLFQLSFEEDHKSLAVRDLLRGKQLGLPSGQATAKFMGPRLSQGRSKVPVLTSDEIGLSDPIDASNVPADTPAPLWYYILSEAKIQNNGEHLGKVGSRIVAEALLGFIESDNSNPSDPNRLDGNDDGVACEALPDESSASLTTSATDFIRSLFV